MPRSALIIDDSRTALASLSQLLKAQGMAVDTVESGPEALDYLRSNAHPGVIFLDHMMPGMDGFETLSVIKRDPALAVVPVVMYTSQEGEAYIGQALALGAIGLLHKPVNPAELTAVLERVDRLRVASRVAITDVINVPEDLRADTPVAETTTGEMPSANAPQSRAPAYERMLWMAGIVSLLLLPAVWYQQRYQQSESLYQAEREANARLRAEQEAARESDTPSEPEVHAPSNQGLLDALAWAINQQGQYGLNDEPLNDARLGMVRELITRLGAARFEGTVRLETHVGEFCLARDDQGALRLPGDATPFLQCEVITYPPAQAQLLGTRQSPAFTRFVAQVRDGPIRVTVVSHGASRPRISYPERASVQNAGDWNQVARVNQRIEVVLVPAR